MKDKLKTKNKSKQPKKSTNGVNKQRPPPIHNSGIGLSKQLAQKLQNSITTPRRNARSTNTKNTDEPRLCGNGRPMPSLAELEQMFEDSDSEPEQSSNAEISDQTSISTNNNNCTTPKSKPLISVDKLKSPNTIKSLAEKMLEYITNLPSDNELHADDGPPPPVIPQKKRKKPDVPYIVGCKDRPKVPSKPSVNFCKGDDYGIDKNGGVEDDNDIPKPRAKRTKAANISKSIFNAQSDEIAARLRELDSPEKDLNDCIPNNFPMNSDRIRSFSPIPSTSRDNDVILKNDHLFNDSLISNEENSINITTEPSDTIVIEDTLPTVKTPVNVEENSINITTEPSDTIVIEDSLPTIKTPVDVEENSINITTEPSETIVIEDTLTTIKTPVDVDYDGTVIVLDDTADEPSTMTSPYNTEDHSCVEVIDNIPTATQNLESAIIVEEYNSIDLYQPSNVDISEVIDVDEVIAESNAIIRKYRSSNNLDTITLVEPNSNTTNNNIDTTGESSINEVNLDTFTNTSANNEQESPIAQLNNVNNNEPTIDVFHEPTTNIPTNNIPTNNIPTNNIPTNNIPTNNIPTNNIPTNNIPTNNIPTNNIPTNNIPTNNIPTNNIPTNNIPTNNIPSNNIITNNIPTNNIPIYNISTNNIPTNDIPTIELDFVDEQSIDDPMEDDPNYVTEVRCIHRHRQRPGRMCAMDLIFPRGSWIIERSGNYIRYEERNPDTNILLQDDLVSPPVRSLARSPMRLPARLPVRPPAISQVRTPRRPPARSTVRPSTQSQIAPSETQSEGTQSQATPSQNLAKSIGLDCPICMEDLSNKSIASTICGHIFCMTCIQGAFRLGGKRCPTCRKVLRHNGYHQIFL